jgi:hypothetical protein
MITARNKLRTVTCNSSFFKKMTHRPCSPRNLRRRGQPT